MQRENASSARLRRDVGREARRVGLHADRADVDDVAASLPLAHHRQEPEDQLQRAEVVELHRALEVVEAVVGVRDRAADRAAGVVDEDVDAAVLGEDLVGHPLDVVEVGEVGRGACSAVPPRVLDLALVSSSFSAVRATSRTMPPASATFRPPPCRSRRRAGDHDDLPRTAARARPAATRRRAAAARRDLLLDDLGRPLTSPRLPRTAPTACGP